MSRCQDCGATRGVTSCQGDLFLCKKCNNKRFPPNASNLDDSSLQHITSIRKSLVDINAQVSNIPVLLVDVKMIKDKQNTMSVSLDYFNELVEELRDRLKVIEQENKDLKKSNMELNERVGVLEKASDDQNQYSRRENLEIHGIPECQGQAENTDNIALQVIKMISPDITTDHLEVTHRIGRTTHHDGNVRGKHQPRPIIVKFSGRKIRDQVFNNKKKMKNVTTRDLGYTERNLIFINENLTPKMRNLLKLVNNKRKTESYRYLWTRNGHIHVKKSDTSNVVTIRNESDLVKIV
ncbi:uncharacterized protein LOC144432723 [Glandiceps talaboti]